MTQLEMLYLSTSTQTQLPISLEWIFELTTLQHLSIAFQNGKSDLIEKVTMLTNLTELMVQRRSAEVPKLAILDVDFGWSRLKDLRVGSICGCRLQLGRSFAGLLDLQHLTYVSFEASHPEGRLSVECYAALAYNLARLRPEVHVVLSSTSASLFLWKP